MVFLFTNLFFPISPKTIYFDLKSFGLNQNNSARDYEKDKPITAQTKTKNIDEQTKWTQESWKIISCSSNQRADKE